MTSSFPNNIVKALRNLDYLKGNYKKVFAWPIAIFVLLIIGWTILLSRLDADKQNLENRALRESAILAQAYGDHLTRNFDAINQIALHVKYEWELARGTLNLQDAWKRGLFPSTELVLVTIVDKNGMPVTSTVPLTKPVSLADREHFRIHKENPSDFLFISKVVTGRVSGKSVIQFTRKLTDEDGTFAGVVVVSVEPAFFALSFDLGILGENGILAVMGEDKQLRVSLAGKAVSSTEHPVLKKIPDMPAPHGSMLLKGPDWFFDKNDRFVGWQALKNYPFVAIAGLDADQVLQPYTASRANAIKLAIAASVIGLIIAVLAMFAVARISWARYQAQVVRDAYRLATDVGSDGFFIGRAIYDQAGEIVDFEIVDCNRRGAEMVQQPRERLLGKRLSSLYSADHFESALKPFRKAMQLGSYDEDYEVNEGSLLRFKWAHKKMVRSGDSLAVTVRDISATKLHIEELERKGNEDALTALHNRHWLHSFLPEALERATRHDSMLALLFIDIDGFKSVNDSMGHAAGDELLRIAASRLQSVIRPHDKVVRLGGDEFLILLEDVEHQNDASHIAQRVLEVFGEKFKLKQGVLSVGVSVGISLFPKDGRDAKTLLQNADVAMYSAKQSGKGQSRFYDPVFYDSLRARLDMERRLRDALDLDQFVMFYQPRVDVETGRICGLEALIRWNHPDEGLVEPLRFIAVAEETGLILRLGKQAMEKVCAQIEQWTHEKHACVPVSINVSPRQFHEGNLRDILAKCMARHDVAPDLVEIEVTESSMMGENAEISMEMEALQRLGVKLLVDDFGTGYSSLSQLQRLDMDGLKIDRAFTSELGRTSEGEVFFTAIVTMAHALGMRVVAEGVETPQQIEILKRLSCDEIQGYYVSRPVPANEVPALIENGVLLAA